MERNQYAAVFSEISSMFKNAALATSGSATPIAPCPVAVVCPTPWPPSATMRGDTFVTRSLSNPNVLVTANAHPAWNARRIIAALVVGGAEANPKGFKKCNPHIRTDRSTSSMAVRNPGNSGRGTDAVFSVR
jgi:hypothetical protein